MLRATATLAAFLLSASQSVFAAQTSFPLGVLATGTMGVTNPPEPTLGTAINQTSMARLLTVNSVDDFCLFAPPTLQSISNSETIEVAWCTKPRNNARLIPDGTISGVSFLKTDFYVQIIGYGDLTKLNIPADDFGGELDPHGAYGTGNPIGGNVTSNITGADEHFAEWMLYIGNGQFCFRVCTNANSTYSAAAMCWHELDQVGCGFVMPVTTTETCDADVAYPPGWYPTATVNGTPEFSSFAQRFTYTPPSGPPVTIGDLTTPAAAYFTPSSSNCVTTSTISNGVNLAELGLSSAPSAPTSGAGTTGNTAKTSGPTSGTTSATSTGTSNTAAPTGSNTSSAARSVNVNDQVYPLVALWALISGLSAVVLLH
ncbi:hypothetical protein CPB84DRAFT_1853630 [Gymnopilus junonius]|uniref:Uncharacterized protein n=1 Tax=Gymnopilus junonius TaxID=109634 RepID=A0A9P5N9T8_GYMJU|nr:hypothetical protein CPB84DRAFT_1853630 [Gymnopilus junonius]